MVAFLADGLQFCSGTLITPGVVLTAGHCANGLGPVPYTVAFGSDSASPTLSVPVAQQVLHPMFTTEGAPYDIALLLLAEPVEGVAPVRLCTTPLTSASVGQPIRHVGFGVSNPAAGDGSGTKRTVTYPITEVDPFVVWSGALGEQTCNGDSGGPGLITLGGIEQLEGVVSDGPDCYDAGWDMRVDVVASWITSTAATWMPDAGAHPADGGPTAEDRSGGCSTAGGGWLGLMALGLLGLGRRRCSSER